MKSFLAAAAAVATTFGLALGSAHAAEGSAVKPLIGIGVTFGGDTLATVQYTNGDSDNIKSGGLIALYGGAEFRLGDQVGLQATVGYHVDDSRGASNGGLRFSRYPIDLVALYSVNDKVRLGLGLQHVNSPKLAGSGVASNVNVDFEASTGAVLEAEYLFSPRIGLKLRGVTHKFKPKGGTGEIDGNHYGLLLNYYF